MKIYFFLMLATLTCALSEHVINKRVLPTNKNCDPDSETCRKGDWIAENIADCKYQHSFPHLVSCDARNDARLSWTVDVAKGDRCKPASGKRFKCGASGTNTRCVCSDKKLPFNKCQCQYWPLEDVGVNSPAFCTGYYSGGRTRVHHWACCNNCGDPTSDTCDGTTWEGGSSGKYCGTCGKNTGGGREKYYFNCGSCTNQEACSNRCDSYDIAGLCWKWLDCFKGCCLESATQPRNKRDVSELLFCGDGTCSDSETPDSCPADCCYQINSVNCTSNISECAPECCHAPSCCLDNENTTNATNIINNKSGSNKGVTVGIPIAVIVAIIIITIISVMIKRKAQTHRAPLQRFENL